MLFGILFFIPLIGLALGTAAGALGAPKRPCSSETRPESDNKSPPAALS